MQQDDLSGWAKAAFLISGIFIPLLSFATIAVVGFGMGPLPMGAQSGRLSQYGLVLFSSPAILWLFPGALFAMIALIHFLFDPSSHSSTLVRVGIPSGVFLAGSLATAELFPLMPIIPDLMLSLLKVAVGLWVLHLFIMSMHRRKDWRIGRAWRLTLSFFLLVYILGCFALGRPEKLVILLAAAMVPVFLGPWVAFVGYAFAWWRLTSQRTNNETERSHRLGWALWSLAFVVCWCLAIMMTLRAYQSLPLRGSSLVP